MGIVQGYESTILAIGVLACIMFGQLLVVDLVGIRKKHLPGAPVAADHSSFLFRASRAVANINESIGIFILAILFCVYAGGSPRYTAYAAWGFVVARFLYMLCYYFNLQVLRSVCFSLSLLNLLVLLVIGFVAV